MTLAGAGGWLLRMGRFPIVWLADSTLSVVLSKEAESIPYALRFLSNSSNMANDSPICF